MQHIQFHDDCCKFCIVQFESDLLQGHYHPSAAAARRRFLMVDSSLVPCEALSWPAYLWS